MVVDYSFSHQLLLISNSPSRYSMHKMINKAR